jgi:exonuclease SbcC
MITRVQIKNWRSHLDTTLDFSEGTNALIGIMGSGKTSILDAICFALFGTFPTAASKKIRLEDVISKKPKEAKESEVQLFFELGNNEWFIKRTISKIKATSSELRRKVGGEWQLVEGPQPSKVNEEVERLLKVDYDLFTRAIYSEQNELDTFLTIPKGQRMRKIDQLLAIDKFECARQSVMALSTRCSRTAEEKQQLLAGLEGSGIAALPQLQAELEQLSQERRRLEANCSAQVETRRSLERQLSELRARRDIYIQLVHELETAKALLSQTEADIDTLKRELTAEEIAYSEMTTADLQARVEQVSATEQLLRQNRESEDRKINDLRSVIASKAAKISLLETDKIPGLKQTIDERDKLKVQLRRLSPKKLKEQIDDCSRSIDRARAAAQRAQLQVEQTEESLNELAKVGAACPICDQPLSDKKKENLEQHKREAIEKLKAQTARQEKATYELTEQLAQLENQLRQANLLDARLEASADSEKQLKFAQDAVQQLRTELEAHSTEARMLEKTLRLLETELESAHAATERLRSVLGKRTSLASKLAKSRELQERTNELSARRAQVRVVTQGELEQMENELAQAISSASAYETRLSSLSALTNEKQARLAELQARLHELERIRAEMAKLQALAGQFKLLEAGLTATQAQLRQNFISAVNQAMHNLWEYLYPYKDFWSCRLAIEEGDYVLQMADSTGWVPADGLVSGGERAMGCLALRMAFALVLAPQLRWLVLDEPTHNLDSRAVDDLAVVLHDRIGEFVDQVFLITHDSALEAAVSGYLYRLERDKEKDGPTSAVRVMSPDT